MFIHVANVGTREVLSPFGLLLLLTLLLVVAMMFGVLRSIGFA